MRLLHASLSLLPFLLPACSGTPDPDTSLTGDRETALLMRREHELSWRDPEETGNPAEVEILLDGLLVGNGDERGHTARKLHFPPKFYDSDGKKGKFIRLVGTV